MPRRSVRTRKRTMGVFSFLIGLTVVAAVGLICAIAIRDRMKPVEQETEAPAPTAEAFAEEYWAVLANLEPGTAGASLKTAIAAHQAGKDSLAAGEELIMRSVGLPGIPG